MHAAFPGECQATLVSLIEAQDPPPLRNYRPDIPVDLETVVLKAMAKARDDRYADVPPLLLPVRLQAPYRDQTGPGPS